jgi:hypothetical protein
VKPEDIIIDITGSFIMNIKKKMAYEIVKRNNTQKRISLSYNTCNSPKILI